MQRIGADAGAIARRLVGRRRPVARTTVLGSVHPRTLEPRSMRVAAVDRETDDAVRIRLVDDVAAPPTFEPGQFLTLVVRIDGVEHRRAYSICSPRSDRAGITVACKRVPRGAVSTYLVEQLRAGDRIGVLGPSGSFRVPDGIDGGGPLVLVAGGSGITPLFSIAASVLEEKPLARVFLLYGNRRLEDVMLRDALEALANEHPLRFRMRHVLEAPSDVWRGGVGRLERTVFAHEIDALLGGAARAASCEWMLCGPAPMTKAVHAELAERGVPIARVRQEQFLLRGSSRSNVSNAAQAAQRVVLHCAGRRFDVLADAGATLLEAGLASGAPMPFSCAVGGCGECRVRLTAGRVDMEEPNCLLPDERERGFVLACVARAASEVEIVIESRGETP